MVAEKDLVVGRVSSEHANIVTEMLQSDMLKEISRRLLKMHQERSGISQLCILVLVRGVEIEELVNNATNSSPFIAVRGEWKDPV